MNIGFDLDKIFINYPPLIPSWIIDRLYKEKNHNTLLYRIPGKFEQAIRKLSHMHILRPPIYENISFLRKLRKSQDLKLYLISSRFGFLKKRTQYIVGKYRIASLFNQMFFNFENQQPHFFKDVVIKKMKIQKYIDDDLGLVRYLAKNNKNTQFFWLNPHKLGKISPNIFAITHISQMFDK